MAADIDDDEVVVDARHSELFFKLVLILLGKHDLFGSRRIDAKVTLAFLPGPKRSV